MQEQEAQRLVLEKLNLRIEKHMSQFVAQRVDARDGVEIPVIGGDALTGRPRLATLHLADTSPASAEPA